MRIKKKRNNENRNIIIRNWKTIIGFLAFVGILLGIFSDGFHIISVLFKSSDQINNTPYIDIRVEPFEYNYNSNRDYTTGTLLFSIQTSNGSYQILDSIIFKEFIVISPDYFVDYGKRPNSILTEVKLDYMILDSRIPEEIGLLILKNEFILKAEKLKVLSISKQKETIGLIILSIPYKFENKIYKIEKQIPIIVYYK